MRVSELNNSVLNLDVATEKPIFIGDNKELNKEWKAIYNEDKKRVSSIVCKNYDLLLHKDFINSVTNVFNSLNVNIDAKLYNYGDRINLDLMFKDHQIKLEHKDEEFMAGVRLINSYDKSTGINIVPIMKRLVCSNGMVIKVLCNGVNIRHNSRVALDLEKSVFRTIKNIIDSNDKFRAYVNDCIGDSLEWSILDQLLEHLIKTKKHKDKINEILNDIEGSITRWDLYNAITNYATHNLLSCGVIDRLQNVAQKVLITPLSIFGERMKREESL